MFRCAESPHAVHYMTGLIKPCFLFQHAFLPFMSQKGIQFYFKYDTKSHPAEKRGKVPPFTQTMKQKSAKITCIQSDHETEISDYNRERIRKTCT